MKHKTVRLLLICLVLGICATFVFAACAKKHRSHGDDDYSGDDDSGPGPHACDWSCIHTLDAAELECEQALRDCYQGCGQDEDCVWACDEANVECEKPNVDEFTQCYTQCDDCLSAAYACNAACAEGDDACFQKCAHQMNSCLGLDQACLDNCSNEYDQCDNACGDSDYVCEADCMIADHQCVTDNCYS